LLFVDSDITIRTVQLIEYCVGTLEIRISKRRMQSIVKSILLHQ